MKKITLFLCLLLTTDWGAKGQSTFAPVGSEWYYSGLSSFGQDAIYFLLHARVSGDTVIAGQTCRVIQQNGRQKNGDGRQGPIQWSEEHQTTLRSFYVYSNSDTTFIYNEIFQRFTPLYIFNVTEGQTVCLPVISDITGSLGGWPLPTPHPLTGDSSFCYTVDSVRMITYDTSVLKTIYIHAVFDPYVPDAHPTTFPVHNWSYAGYKSLGAYAEKIGGLRGGLLPKPIYFAELFDGMEPTQFLDLDCYTDDARRIRLSAEACDYLPPTTLSIQGGGRNVFTGRVYPNPTENRITIRPERPFERDQLLIIYDIAGKVLEQSTLPAGKAEVIISLEHHKPGLYYLSVSSKQGKYYQKIILHR